LSHGAAADRTHHSGALRRFFVHRSAYPLRPTN
jgi:hypothetical protein